MTITWTGRVLTNTLMVSLLKLEHLIMAFIFLAKRCYGQRSSFSSFPIYPMFFLKTNITQLIKCFSYLSRRYKTSSVTQTEIVKEERTWWTTKASVLQIFTSLNLIVILNNFQNIVSDTLVLSYRVSEKLFKDRNLSFTRFFEFRLIASRNSLALS